MKRLFLCSSAIFTIALFSCSKANESVGAESGNWIIGTTEYGGTNVSRTSTLDYAITAETTDGSSMQVFFGGFPTAAGSFNIVNESKASTHTLAANEVAVEYNVGASDVYLSKGDDAKVATVTVTATGKLNITIPTINVEHFAGAGSLGSTTASGHIIE